MASGAGWCVEFFREPKSGRCPALEFLDAVPDPVEGELLATLDAVEGTEPPFAFRGGLRWHAMKDEMGGFYEARDEHDGILYRLFVRFDRDAPGLPHNAIVVIDGGHKPVGEEMHPAVYEKVRLMWALYLRTDPRSVC